MTEVLEQPRDRHMQRHQQSPRSKSKHPWPKHRFVFAALPLDYGSKADQKGRMGHSVPQITPKCKALLGAQTTILDQTETKHVQRHVAYHLARHESEDMRECEPSAHGRKTGLRTPEPRRHGHESPICSTGNNCQIDVHPPKQISTQPIKQEALKMDTVCLQGC